MNDIDILIIDDQYGSSEGFRTGFLKLVGAVSEHGKTIKGYPYKFTFHSGQDGNKKNSPKAVEEQIRERWPAQDGSRWALVLLDVRFDQKPPTKNDEKFGFDVLQHLRSSFGSDLPVVMLTSEDESKRRKANIAAADGFLPKGALSKEALEKCIMSHGLIPDTRSGKSNLLIGHSLSLLKTLRGARRYAINQQGSLIIFGETGSGKTELARYIHELSLRTGEFRSWTAAPHFDSTIYQEKLFGVWVGAHSKADTSKAGEIELAHKGTFLLDEVGDLPLDAQNHLLEFRRRTEGGFRIVARVGVYPRLKKDRDEAKDSIKGELRADHKILVDVLFLTATNKPLYDAAYRKEIRFREDLFADLGSPINFPSLNERREDVREIFLSFVSNLRKEPKKEITVSTDVLELLEKRDWKNSNIVGLKSIAEAAVSNLGDFDEILLHHLPAEIKSEASYATGKKIISEIATQAPSDEAKESKSSVEVPITLQNLVDILNTMPIDKDDPALLGAKTKLEGAFQKLMKRLAGASLERCMDPLKKEFNRQSAMRLLTGDESLKGKGPGRVLNEILGRKQENEIKDEELEELVAQWKASLKSR